MVTRSELEMLATYYKAELDRLTALRFQLKKELDEAEQAEWLMAQNLSDVNDRLEDMQEVQHGDVG